MAEVEVVGIRVLEDNDQPVMVLRVVGSTRYLPVWVDTVSAAALMSVVGGELEGPALTFDLFSKLLSRLGDPALSGRITGWDDGVYSAELVVDGGRSRPGCPTSRPWHSSRGSRSPAPMSWWLNLALRLSRRTRTSSRNSRASWTTSIRTILRSEIPSHTAIGGGDWPTGRGRGHARSTVRLDATRPMSLHPMGLGAYRLRCTAKVSQV